MTFQASLGGPHGQGAFLMSNHTQEQQSNVNDTAREPREFLECLFGRYYASGGQGLIEIRPVSGREIPISEFYGSPSELVDDMPHLHQQNDLNFNSYIGVNPRPLDKNKKQEDIVDIVALWLDVDTKNYEGRKEEALAAIKRFPLKPNIIADSGNGYHVYWVLETPIIDRDDEQTKRLTQVLAGLLKALKADAQARNFDRVLRLPGTMNVKNPDDPKPCVIVQIDESRFYTLEDFADYRDTAYEEPEEVPSDTDFEGEEVLVNRTDKKMAGAMVANLRVKKNIRKMILTGELKTSPGSDHTRSGRDMSIITALVAAGYNAATIRSVCQNPLLGCSDRFIEMGSKAAGQLDYEISKARQYVGPSSGDASPQVRAIKDIRAIPDMKAAEKVELIAKYVVKDLFENVGAGYKHEASKTFYSFDSQSKKLMDIDGIDFTCFMKHRYELPEKDVPEVHSWIRAHLWMDGLPVEPRIFAYYDNIAGVLYISDQASQFYRLDGDSIGLLDNGSEGVFFKNDTGQAALGIDPASLTAVNYMEDGFDWEQFQEKSLLYEHLIDKASFDVEVTHALTAQEQKYLYSVYVHSLFFESVQEEKPIACVTGVKASGKSFTLAATGKLLFGESFQLSHLADTPKDFKVGLAENYYLCFDNLDSSIKPEYLDAFCVAATGGRISGRKLYTNNEEITVRPHVFLAITSRDIRFRRDDFVDRLIIFNTAKVTEPKSKSVLFGEILSQRKRIWEELLVNLNSAVRLLNARRGWNPPGIFRIADWELFGKKLHNDIQMPRFVDLLRKMNREKADFSLEDDEIFLVLSHLCLDKDETIEDVPSSELYKLFAETAQELKLDTFPKRYKSSKSLCKRLVNIQDELGDTFQINIQKGHANRNSYSISKRPAA